MCLEGQWDRYVIQWTRSEGKEGGREVKGSPMRANMFCLLVHWPIPRAVTHACSIESMN